MDVFKLLKEDHQKVKSIFHELEDTTERALKTREHLFTNLKMELTLHAEAEEKFFYPKLVDPKPSHELALEAIEEHKVVKTLLAELDTDAKNTEEWAAKLKVLQENVEHHVEEEEGQLFPKAKKIISEAEAISIAAEIEAFKEEASAMEEG
jgi:hemerythrin superfamily protein